jgi:single-stranded DNA-binding protein
VAWGDVAEAARSLTKGTEVTIAGALRTNNWTTKEG